MAATSTPSSASTPSASSAKSADPWHQGSVESAFALARERRVPILLYWGAQWCPPCNELKSQVFSKPRFAELMRPMVAVYLDGDAEAAQAWGEKLKVSGYPTVLLLDASGQERMRLTISLNMDEFENALKAALASERSLAEILDRARQGQATDADWRVLATHAWFETWSLDDHGGLQLGGEALLTAQRDLALKAPAHLVEERAMLAAAFLEAAATATDASVKSKAENFRQEASELVDRMLLNDRTIKAARATICHMAVDIMNWMHAQNGPTRSKHEARWLKAAEQLRGDQSQSLDVRLWAAYVPVALARAKSPSAELSASLKENVRQAVREATLAAQTAFDRKVVISGAAAILRRIGDFDDARKLLYAELAKTDTPWYLQSSYAALEKAAGRPEEALRWSERARLSAKGRASRLQWIVEDLALTASIAAAPKSEIRGLDERIRVIAQEYYETALALDDGFQGRNARRAQRVAELLKPRLSDAHLLKLVERQAKRCGAGADCQKHFASLLPGA